MNAIVCAIWCVFVAQSSLFVHSHRSSAIITFFRFSSPFRRFFVPYRSLDNNSDLLTAIRFAPPYDKRLVYRLLYSLQCYARTSLVAHVPHRHFSRHARATPEHSTAAGTLAEYQIRYCLRSREMCTLCKYFDCFWSGDVMCPVWRTSSALKSLSVNT